MVVVPTVHASASRVHEEIADGAELQAQLLGDGDLHFLGWTLVLLKDGDERTALQVGEDQPLLLGRCVAVLVLLLLLALAGLVWMAAVGGMGMRVRGKEGGKRTQNKVNIQKYTGCTQTNISGWKGGRGWRVATKNPRYIISL